MRYIEIGNAYYFFYIIVTLLIIFALYLFLKNKSEIFKKRVLFSILLSAFAIHFLKYFIEPYTTIPSVQRIRKVSFENISATHTLLFPFVFLSNNKTLKDYLVLGGIVSGIVPIVYPLDAMAPTFDGAYYPVKEAFSIEVIRFYFAHMSFLIVGFLMLALNLHKIDVHYAYRTLFILLGILVILFVNEVVLTWLKLIPKENLFDQNGRNPSLIFGIRTDALDKLGFMHKFVPKFMYMRNNEYHYWPVLWLIGPIIFIGGLFILVLCLLIDYRSTIDMFKRKQDTQMNEDVKQIQ